jgi:hypothetical protein
VPGSVGEALRLRVGGDLTRRGQRSLGCCRARQGLPFAGSPRVGGNDGRAPAVVRGSHWFALADELGNCWDELGLPVQFGTFDEEPEEE